MKECDTHSPEMNILKRYSKEVNQIKEIQELRSGTIQIAVEGGRIWIDARLSVSQEMGIKPYLSVKFLDDKEQIPRI